AFFSAGSLFAQEEPGDLINWASLELNFVGYGVRYERMLSSQLSVGANFYSNGGILLGSGTSLGVGAFVRYYPWTGNFFAGAGVGYHTIEKADIVNNKDVIVSTTGIAITPEVGWRIDVGYKGGFYVQPGIRVPISFGVSNAPDEDGIQNDVGFTPYLSLGWAF
ncbi:MAG: hypothetical protein FWD91_01330, partial [Treponema sp.]|nr:hypothetical protein [Treponema sp.]